MSQNSIFVPHMPEVDIRPEIDAIFSRAREYAQKTNEDAEGALHRQVIIVSPGRLLIAKDCPTIGEIPEEQLVVLEELIPPSPRLNIAVIAYTFLDALKENLLQAIPSFGFLLAFAALGHAVWVFEGHPTSLSAGCREADLLLVDSGMLPDIAALTPDWRKRALQSMRGSEIKILARPKK